MERTRSFFLFLTKGSTHMLVQVFILPFIQDLRSCRQRAGEVDNRKTLLSVSVDGKFTGSVQTYSCHSTLHALPLNASAIAHNDTLYLR